MSYILASLKRRLCMEGLLLMSRNERQRKVEMESVVGSRQTVVEAARRLSLSYRQCARVLRRYRDEGDVGLVHRGRGRPSPRAKPAALRSAVISRYVERYEGFEPTLASEKLAEEDGYVVHPETLRRWLIAEGRWKRCRKRSKHRQRRVRKKHFGELVQMDGSHHRWFGEASASSCLVVMIDDATGERMSVMSEQETTAACMRALWRWIERYGVPHALYTDRKNVFVTDRAEPTPEEQLAGMPALTAFGKACFKLGIEIIKARSPQAKGRVERAHGVYQDRFIKELWLREMTSIDEANELLSGGFDESFCRKFAKKPASRTDFHQPVPKGLELAGVFSFEQTRVVSNDWCVRFNNRFFQILKQNAPRPRRRDKIIVRELLDGKIELLYHEHKLRYKEIEQPTASLDYNQPQPTTTTKPKQPRKKHKPAADHPWRHPIKLDIAAASQRKPTP
jgi:hypothetical protein